MMALQLVGRDADDLRQMAQDWWVYPLAGALLAARPATQALVFAVTARPDARVRGRLFPAGQVGTPPPDWDRQVQVLHQTLFVAPLGALDEDEGFARAWGAFCDPEPGIWAPISRLARSPLRHTGRGDRAFSLEKTDLAVQQCADTEAPAAQARAARHAAAALDPEVEALLEGLEAIDQRDQLVGRLAALLDLLNYHRNDHVALQAALDELQATLEAQMPGQPLVKPPV